MAFYDLDDRQILSNRFEINYGATTYAYIKIDCVSGKTLKSTSADHLAISGRKSGDTPWIDLESTGIDLTSWDGDRETFEIKFIATNPTSRQLDSFTFYLA